jgi:O-antigen ligase
VLALVPPLVLCALAGRAQSQAPRGRWLVIVAIAAVVAAAGSVIADRQVGCKGELTHGRIGIWRAGINTAADRPLQGFGSGTFLAASRAHQLKERPIPTKFAHDLPLESWIELGVAGLLLVAAWYGAVAALRCARFAREPHVRLRARACRRRVPAHEPLLDWPWHLLGAGMLWAVAAGGLVACSEIGVRR